MVNLSSFFQCINLCDSKIPAFILLKYNFILRIVPLKNLGINQDMYPVYYNSEQSHG